MQTSSWNSDPIFEGGLAVAVPGEIRGYWEAHRKYGILPWGDLFQPAIDLCENGSAVQRPLALQLQKQRDRILAEPTMSEIFVDPKTGDVLKEGDMMYRRKLGETLREIAVSGPDAFYRGSVAEKLLRDLGKFGSIITAEDLANYTVDAGVHDADQRHQRGPAHHHGPDLGPGARFHLEGHGGLLRTSDTVQGPGELQNWTTAEQSLFMHRLAETFKHAYGRRANLGDPAFLADDIEFRQTMTSFADERFVNFIRSRINDSSIVNDPSHYGGKVSTEDGGTAHLSIVDEAGLAVSVTSTINYGFGALIRSPSTGIILNNEMDDFATPNATNVWGQQPSSKNYPEPGKRPLSSMCPSILVDKDTKLVKMIIGGAGGTRITTAIAYVLSLVYGGNEDPTDATAFKRLHHQLFPPYLQHEIDYPPEILDDLRARGHETKSYSTIPGSVVVSIQGAPDGTWYAVTDGRKAGDVAGL